MTGHSPEQLGERQIRETESRFKNMADASPVLLWMAGTDGLCTFFNQTWLRFTGRSLEEEWGSGGRRASTSRISSVHGHLRRRVQPPGGVRDGVSVAARRRRISLDPGPGTPALHARGTFAGYIGSCIDITERRQLEADLRKAVKVRDEFLSVASHELRTPLTSLKLRGERLYRAATRSGGVAQTNGRFERDAEGALAQVLHLVKMVDVLLDVSRIAEGPLTLDRDDLDVAPLVAGVADRFKEPASTAGSPIRVEIRDTATKAPRSSSTCRWSRLSRDGPNVASACGVLGPPRRVWRRQRPRRRRAGDRRWRTATLGASAPRWSRGPLPS